MKTETIKILLIEDNPGDARLIQEFLKNQPHRNFDILQAGTLAEGLEQLGSGQIDVVVADLGLPDSQGIETLEKILEKKPTLPVIVVTGLKDELIGITAVQKGAQDFLVKDQFNEELLYRIILYAIERKEAANRRLLTNRILAILNRENVWQQLIHDILIEIKVFTGIEAIGVRIKNEKDYPYFEVTGFDSEFTQEESSLCSRDSSGNRIEDEDGKLQLDCMCGRIIRGRIDQSNPFYSGKRSFWTNSTSKLIAEFPELYSQLFSRNRCRREGYESLALIPLYAGDEVVGLLQLNDRSTNCFNLSKIMFFEEIGSTLGIAFQRMENERELQERIKELNVLHNIAIIAEISSSIGEYAQGIVDMIPMGFQDSEHTCCKLEIDGKIYQTKNCPDSKYLYVSDILYNGRKVGRLDIGITRSPNQTSSTTLLQEEKELIITIAKQIGDYMGRDRSDKIQRIIYNISTYTNTTINLEELVMFIQKQLSDLIDTTNFYIAMYDKDTDQISIPYFADQKDSITSFPAGKTLTAYVIRSRKPLLGKRADLDELAASGKIETIGEKARVWLGIPLQVKSNVIGVFAVQSYTDENAYTENDLTMLEMISQQISISVERKKAESDLRRALEKATESDRVKSAFLANMSHELRTPLNAVIGFSQLIDAETPMDEVLECLSHIHRGGQHLLEIIEDILNISVLEGGSVEVTKTNIQLLPFLDQINEAVKEEKRKIKKAHLDVRFIQGEEELDIWLLTDKEKLKQILMNLLKNALKFTNEGSVEWGARKDVQENRAILKLWIRDTGIGIPEPVREIIFDIFRQANESHTRTHGGTGLGLSVTRKLTELLGGSIWVESEEGKGSTFHVNIPLEGEMVSEKRKLPVEQPDEKLTLSGKIILVAEDEESNFELMEILLTGKGCHILWAKNGHEAIQLCSEHPEIDLVLMDLKMPIVNGYEATAQIRASNPNLPVIAQTAYAMPSDRQEAMEAGCNDLITKPIKTKELYQTIARWLV
ncbi:MAG: response regulator [Bacteroidales bacterium]|nr:response regulator [Bacteroidales bacterium]